MGGVEGPRGPSFWLYGEERKPSLGGFRPRPGKKTYRYKCSRCDKTIFSSTGAPRCPKCGGSMRRV